MLLNGGLAAGKADIAVVGVAVADPAEPADPARSGVVVHRKSLETTSEMWDRVRDEHNWIREAMMAMLASFISIGASESSGAE